MEGYIKAAAAGKNKKMQSCYSADKLSDEAKTEISSTIKYFQAHGVKDVNIDSCGSISENKNYSYVYIRYNLVLENEQEYPCISTYLVRSRTKSIICMHLLRSIRLQPAGCQGLSEIYDYENLYRLYKGL